MSEKKIYGISAARPRLTITALTLIASVLAVPVAAISWGVELALK